MTSTFPSQCDDFMVEEVEREALSQVSFEVRLKEIVSPLKEIPGMIELDTPQPGELMLLTLRAENPVESGCCEYSSGANSGSNELIVLVGDGTEDSSAVGSHKSAVRLKGLKVLGSLCPTNS